MCNTCLTQQLTTLFPQSVKKIALKNQKFWKQFARLNFMKTLKKNIMWEMLGAFAFSARTAEPNKPFRRAKFSVSLNLSYRNSLARNGIGPSTYLKPHTSGQLNNEAKPLGLVHKSTLMVYGNFGFMYLT